MIDIQKAKETFLEYSMGFDQTDESIARKIGHSLRVMDISTKLAESMNLEKEKIDLATLIGLLHDIGRFEQKTRFGTFRDADSIDHGDLGVEILFKDSFLRKFIEETKYDNIILKAIKNHNKYAIENGLNGEELLFTKIIRDSDKIDILYEAETMFYKGGQKDEIENSSIDKYIEVQIENMQQIVRKKGVKPYGINDVLCVISFIFDINFKESFEIIKNKNYIFKSVYNIVYINNIINRFEYINKETKEKVEIIRKNTNKYIEEKIKER